MKKSIFRWGFVLCMLLGLMTIAASAAAPAKTVCPTGHEGWKDLNEYLKTVTPTDKNGYSVEAGNYYLSDNLDLSYYLKLAKKATLCLNGYTLDFSSGNATYKGVRAGTRTFTVCDCSEDHSGVMSASGAGDKGYFIDANGGSIVLEGGTFNCAHTNYGINTTKGSIYINGANVVVSGARVNDVYLQSSENADILEVLDGTIGEFVIKEGQTATATVYGGTFTQMDADTVAEHLTDDAPVCIEAAGSGCVVTPGYKRSGETVDFESDLNLNLTLGCDSDFVAESVVATVDGSAVEAAVVDGVVSFAVNGITAKDIGKDMSIVVTSADGATYYQETFSVADIAKEQYAATEDEAIKALMVDVINYGNAAAAEFGGTIVDALGSGADTLVYEWNHSEGYGASAADMAVATLSLKDKIVLNIYINGQADVGVYDETTGITTVTYDDIAIADAMEPITLTFTVDGTEYTVVYSIADYVIDALGGAQADLISALQKYIDSVCAVCAEA